MRTPSPSTPTLNTASPCWTVIAGLFGLTGVALGAVAAHTISDPQAAAALERAATYQILHAIVLLYACTQTGSLARLARLLFTSGILLFCGAIEVKYLLLLPSAAAVAPTGGVCLMLGWLFVALTAIYDKKYKI